MSHALFFNFLSWFKSSVYANSFQTYTQLLTQVSYRHLKFSVYYIELCNFPKPAPLTVILSGFLATPSCQLHRQKLRSQP